jgi:DNA-binding NarL/FixJ family response regulator
LGENKIKTKTKMKTNQSLFDRLCSRADFVDLKPSDRSGDKPLQRQAVWYVMRKLGITFREIAEQSHRTHGTVVVGVKRFKGYLSVNNREAVQMYQNVIKVAQNGKE